LLKAGKRSTLIVGEAMGHCYFYSPQLPESRDAYAAITAFFRENLK
jgi:acetyl esterase/lipase